jgi:uncharacterized protein YeaO (DUF488 family)
MVPAPYFEEEDLELYTSHWENRDLAGLDMVKVGISRGVPRGKKAKQLPYRYKRLPALFPSSDLLKAWKAREISPDEYTPIYRSYLDSLGAEEVTGQLEKKSADNEGKPLVLLCWCLTGDFCHRRVWADWYLEKTGQEVPELAELA